MNKRARNSAVLSLAFAIACTAVPPTDNPIARFYDGAEGYPAWTDRIKWSSVVDMSQYRNGNTDFERFENARDRLAENGGGVLYYPAGTYDFSDAPMDGPGGRGLMLKSGVVIRGQAPEGKPNAVEGALELATKFVFGFTDRENAVETGPRASVWLDGAILRGRNKRPGMLQLAFAAPNNQIDAKSASASTGPVERPSVVVEVSTKAAAIALKVELPDSQAIYQVKLARDDDSLCGSFSGIFEGEEVSGRAHGAFFETKAQTPRDWNFIGLRAEDGGSVGQVDNVGIAWVHMTGATVFFGPEMNWGPTWRTAGSWKSKYVKDSWADRVPDGTHPWDALAGGGEEYHGAGTGRLVFGCLLEDAVAVNNSITMGRSDTPEGFGKNGYYMAKFTPRIGAYGSRIFVANNRIPRSAGRNFKYPQLTRYSHPHGPGSIGLGDESVRLVLFDYNKACGIDINKVMLGLTANRKPDDKPRNGFFEEGVVVRDNYVYNHGHKGFNISGAWTSITNNHNERAYLQEAQDPYCIGGWELTLDGYLQSSPGGNGAISDNLSRAFDLAGANQWAHGNYFNNVGSNPGNDGEGLLCQAHGGTHIYSWAWTANRHDKGSGQSSYIGAWNVRIHGMLIAFNRTAGWVGGKMFSEKPTDTAIVANKAAKDVEAPGGVLTSDPGGSLRAPTDVVAGEYRDDAVRITWTDQTDNEVGFRVERRIENGPWATIAYRPPQIEKDGYNPPVWVDFLAPSNKTLQYRVAAINSADDDSATSPPSNRITLSVK